MTHTIQGPNLTRNPPPHATFDESIWHYRRRLLCVGDEFFEMRLTLKTQFKMHM